MKPTVRSNWATTVLVCAKCSKKLHGGFGEKGRTPLAKALKHLGGGKKRKAPFGVIETRCLGVCPKGAVTVIDAAHPGLWMIVEEGLPMEQVAARLGLTNR
jgi:predicted metal-binding protein